MACTHKNLRVCTHAQNPTGSLPFYSPSLPPDSLSNLAGSLALPSFLPARRRTQPSPQHGHGVAEQRGGRLCFGGGGGGGVEAALQHYTCHLGPVYTTVEKSTTHENKGCFSIVIGRKCNSWPVGVHTRWRKQWW